MNQRYVVSEVSKLGKRATMREPVKGQQTNRDIETESLYQGLFISGTKRNPSVLVGVTVSGR